MTTFSKIQDCVELFKKCSRPLKPYARIMAQNKSGDYIPEKFFVIDAAELERINKTLEEVKAFTSEELKTALVTPIQIMELLNKSVFDTADDKLSPEVDNSILNLINDVLGRMGKQAALNKDKVLQTQT